MNVGAAINPPGRDDPEREKALLSYERAVLGAAPKA
jgi:hypothetical protein